MSCEVLDSYIIVTHQFEHQVVGQHWEKCTPHYMPTINIYQMIRLDKYHTKLQYNTVYPKFLGTDEKNSVDPCCRINRGKMQYGDTKGTKNAMSVVLCCQIHRVVLLLLMFIQICYLLCNIPCIIMMLFQLLQC